MCNAWPAKSKIVHGIGSNNRARRMRLQPARTRQRGSDLGDSLAATSAAVRGAGEGKSEEEGGDSGDDEKPAAADLMPVPGKVATSKAEEDDEKPKAAAVNENVVNPAAALKKDD